MTDKSPIDPAIVAASKRAAEAVPVVDFRTLVNAPAEELRAAYDAICSYWNSRPPTVQSVVDLEKQGPHGALPLRVYRPHSEPGPGLLYFHGGGFMLGSLETHDTVCRLLARETGAAVVAVDYRLAPEHRFPVAVEECIFACDWLVAHGSEIGVDTARLAVGGDSAGANLALTVLNERRDPLSGGVLFYGSYGHLPEHGYPLGRAAEAFGDGRYGLGLPLIRYFYASYLGDQAGTSDPRFCSLKCDFSGLPPVLLTAAAVDPLLDDSEALRSHFQAAGVPHSYIVYPGMPHGFLMLAPWAEPARRPFRDAAAYLKTLWHG